MAPQLPAVNFDDAEIFGEELKGYVTDILLRLQQEQQEHEESLKSRVESEN